MAQDAAKEPATSLPLEQRNAFHSRDLDEARDAVTRVFCSHRLHVVDGEIDVTQHSAALRSISLHYLDYGAAVRIDPEPLESFYLLQIPLAGAAFAESRGREVVSDPNMATLLGPQGRVRMRWSTGSPHLCLRVDRAALEAKVARLTGHRLRDRLHFDLGVRLDTPQATSMRHYLEMLRLELESDNPLAQSPLMIGQIEDLVLTSLLLAAPNTYSDRLTGGSVAADTPRTVRRALQLMQEHADEPLTVEDVAEAVGTSVRALQAGFRRHTGSTPMTYLRDLRLESVHRVLIGEDPTGGAVSVTDVALAHGFTHLGRFAQMYRQRFGQSPSETLKR